MEFRSEKRALLRFLTIYGIEPSEFAAKVREHFPAIPAHLIKRWKAQFYNAAPVRFTTTPRLANRFMIGADPEFVFSNEVGYVYAQNAGLGTTSAFGADLCGRMAELRAYPSRSVVEVVASLLDTLRWMAFAHPQLLQYKWSAPAIQKNDNGTLDGIGGHIHFGKKRDIPGNVAVLDTAATHLLGLDVLDRPGQLMRIRHTHYGSLSDHRVQSHGFEYRTLPTWMQSPYAAFITLTIAKLAVLHGPEIIEPDVTPRQDLLLKAGQRTAYLSRVQNLLMQYKNEDDDALIAFQAILKWGLPVYSDFDMKSSWGISRDLVAHDGNYFFPPVIKPSAATIKQVFDSLTSDTRRIAPVAVDSPTWSPFKLPANLKPLMFPAHTFTVGDIAQGLLAKSAIVDLRVENLPNCLRVLAYGCNIRIAEIQKYVKKNLPGVTVTFEVAAAKKMSLSFNFPAMRLPGGPKSVAYVQRMRDFLTCGLFPIAKYGEIEQLDVEKFLAPIAPKKAHGKVIFSSADAPVADGEAREAAARLVANRAVYGQHWLRLQNIGVNNGIDNGGA